MKRWKFQMISIVDGKLSISISKSLIRHPLIKSILRKGLMSYMLILPFSSIRQSVSFGKRGLYS